jgi:serine phosphatase RsbU (regulator of sigma subunit)
MSPEKTARQGIGARGMVRARAKRFGRRGRNARMTGHTRHKSGAGRRLEDQASAVLREAASVVSQGLLIIDADMRIVFVNDPYLEFFDLTRDATHVAEGAALEDQLRFLAERGEYGPGDPDSHVEARMAPVRERRSFDLDRQLSTGRHVHITGSPTKSGGYVYSFTDVTGRVEEKERLDKLVRDRTEELREANSKLVDGIKYASMIQSGILPNTRFYDTHLADHFLFFRPAELVGGDFYVGVKTDYGVYVGLGDCTGHGIPGAMMTMMAASVCRRAINESGLGGPAAVMMAVDHIVRTNLHQTEAQVGPDNGLELSLCLIEPEQGRVRAAAAGLDMFIQKDGALDRVKGTKHGLGYGRQTSSATQIRETVLTMKDADRLFMSSDGILDQSGGEKGFGFGRRRMMEALEAAAAGPIKEQGDALVAALETYRGDHPQRDDLAVMGFATGPR